MQRDHFDREVEASLRRDLPIITTPHAKVQLDDYKSPEERFSAVTDLDTFESALVEIKKDGGPLAENGRRPAIKVTAMPGKHVPPGFIEALNDFLRAVRTASNNHPSKAIYAVIIIIIPPCAMSS